MKIDLTINIAKDEYGKDLVINLDVIKNLLVSGITGSGKSVLLHKIISTLISNNDPEILRFILIDPKLIELSVYNKILHLLTPVINVPKKSILAMKWSIKEMERRYEILNAHKVQNIDAYHKTILEPAMATATEGIMSDESFPEMMPHIIIVIDELSVLMEKLPKEAESVISKIAEMGHAVGIHIILSTSRPSTKILKKSIRDLITARVALKTSSSVDSKIIIGNGDAHLLRGSGDMLFRDGMKYVIHGQANMISYDEIKTVVKSNSEIHGNNIEPIAISLFLLDDDISDGVDSLYEDAKKITLKAGKISTSFLQRKLGVGYSRAASLIDMLEQKGVVGPMNKKTMVRKVKNK
jgi:S-DNA-T family DNA segregation ATPase FtsK/SpoIIIE